jgi:hypothetical protein
VAARTSHVDLVPTLLELLGLPADPALPGGSRLDELEGSTAPALAPAYAWLDLDGRVVEAVLLDEWKLIRTLARARDQPPWAVYHLGHDPEQSQVRAQLSLVLEGVLSQQLIPTADGRGRAMSLEIMVATPAIRNLIREEKVHQIYSAMQAGQKFGMQTMNQSLAELVQKRRISREEALNRSTLPEELAGLLGTAPAAAAGTPAAVAGAGAGSPFGRR